jgi:hypothetical protein
MPPNATLTQFEMTTGVQVEVWLSPFNIAYSLAVAAGSGSWVVADQNNFAWNGAGSSAKPSFRSEWLTGQANANMGACADTPAVAIDGCAFYYTHGCDGINAVPRATGTDVRLVPAWAVRPNRIVFDQDAAAEPVRPNRIAVDQDAVYWTDATAIGRVPLP